MSLKFNIMNNFLFNNNSKILRYVVITFTAFSLIWLLRVLMNDNFPDFNTNYYASINVINNIDPYSTSVNYFTPQVYPPFDILFYVPIGFLPFYIASKLWIILSIAAVFITIFLLTSIYKISFFSTYNIFLMGLVCLSFPLKFTLGMGQLNNIILVLIAFSFYYFNLKKYVYSGIILAFPILLKFFPLLLIPYLVYIKKWKIVLIFILTTIFLMLLTCFILTFPVVINYYQNILPELLSSWKGDYYNQSLSGVLIRIFPDKVISNYLRIIISAILLFFTAIAIVIKRKKNQKRLNLEFAAILTVSVIINNFSWQHHFVFLLVPYFIVLFTLLKIKVSSIFYAFLFLSYICIAVNSRDPSSLHFLLQNHVFFGALILWMLIIYILVKIKIK